jgi:hypothetical protein
METHQDGHGDRVKERAAGTLQHQGVYLNCPDALPRDDAQILEGDGVVALKCCRGGSRWCVISFAYAEVKNVAAVAHALHGLRQSPRVLFALSASERRRSRCRAVHGLLVGEKGSVWIERRSDEGVGKG